MKIHLIILALAAAIGVSRAADAPIDLTAADTSKFKEELGHVVTLRGRLENGKQGLCLYGATTNVSFYVIPDELGKTFYSYPGAWMRLVDQQVRVTGELKFQSFDRSNAKPTDQVPPDFYYMVLQRAKIEREEQK